MEQKKSLIARNPNIVPGRRLCRPKQRDGMAEFDDMECNKEKRKMEKRKQELTDEMLNAVAGGTGITEEIPEAAAAEGLTVGTKLIDKYPCDKCGHIGSTVVQLWSDYMTVECDKCKIWGIYGYGGYGYTKA